MMGRGEDLRPASLNAAECLRAEVSWSATDDPIRPYEARVGPDTWAVQVNDFPDEQLYTLLINGQESGSFDDWPAQWKRQRAFTKDAVQTGRVVEGLGDTRKRGDAVSRIPEAAVGAEGDHTYGWRRRFDSFGEQWLSLFQHFLLLLFALGFTVVMHRFLEFGFLESITRYVKPILLAVDVLVVFVFGLEMVAVLAIDVYEKRARRGVLPSGDESAQPVGIALPESYATENPGLRAFQEESDQEAKSAHDEKVHATFTKDAVEMPKAVATLGSYHSRVDAVSRCELPFWLSDGDQFADEYFKSAMAIVRKGKIVTQMFLVSREEFEQGQDLLFEVLLKHHRAGIGFAVVPYQELPFGLRERAGDLDFALWNRGNAYSRFRHEGDYHRKMSIKFSMDGRNGDVADKVHLYKQMLPHAWLVDQNYTDHHKDWIEELGGELKRSNAHLYQRIGKRIAPEGEFYLQVHNEEELRKRVEGLVALWELTQKAPREEHPHEVKEEPRRGREQVP
jgi:hypothetical protein